jgi:hypothetical protein
MAAKCQKQMGWMAPAANMSSRMHKPRTAIDPRSGAAPDSDLETGTASWGGAVIKTSGSGGHLVGGTG